MLEVTYRGHQLQDLLSLQCIHQECDISTLHKACTAMLSSNEPSLTNSIPLIMSTAAAITTASDTLQSKITDCLHAVEHLSKTLLQFSETNRSIAVELRKRPQCQELALERDMLSSVQLELGQRAAYVARVRGHCTLPPFSQALETIRREAMEKFKQISTVTHASTKHHVVPLAEDDNKAMAEDKTNQTGKIDVASKEEFEALARHVLALQESFQKFAKQQQGSKSARLHKTNAALRGDAAPSSSTDDDVDKKDSSRCEPEKRSSEQLQEAGAKVVEATRMMVDRIREKEKSFPTTDREENQPQFSIEGKENIDILQSQGRSSEEHDLNTMSQKSAKDDNVENSNRHAMFVSQHNPDEDCIDHPTNDKGCGGSGSDTSNKIADIHTIGMKNDRAKANMVKTPQTIFTSQKDSTSPGSNKAKSSNMTKSNPDATPVAGDNDGLIIVSEAMKTAITIEFLPQPSNQLDKVHQKSIENGCIDIKSKARSNGDEEEVEDGGNKAAHDHVPAALCTSKRPLQSIAAAATQFKLKRSRFAAEVDHSSALHAAVAFQDTLSPQDAPEENALGSGGSTGQQGTTLAQQRSENTVTTSAAVAVDSDPTGQPRCALSQCPPLSEPDTQCHGNNVAILPTGTCLDTPAVCPALTRDFPDPSSTGQRIAWATKGATPFFIPSSGNGCNSTGVRALGATPLWGRRVTDDLITPGTARSHQGGGGSEIRRQGTRMQRGHHGAAVVNAAGVGGLGKDTTSPCKGSNQFLFPHPSQQQQQ